MVDTHPETEEKMTNEFKTYHPIVNFIYFVFMIVFSCVFMHPVSLSISFVSAFSYSVILKGRKSIKTNILYMLPTVILLAVLNPAFNHQGVTILTYLPGGNPLTLESIVYGVSAAVMVISVICWFSCYNEVMTSDKFIYLFGRIIPSLSLILSMTLRFVPRFIKETRSVADAQRGIGNDVSGGSILNRAKTSVRILSIMITWSLENAVDTADSMKSRGYGTKRRTAFSIFRFDRRDVSAILAILILGTYTIVGVLLDGMYFSYFPSIKFDSISGYSVSVFTSYTAMAFMPVIIEVWEVTRWKAIKSKI